MCLQSVFIMQAGPGAKWLATVASKSFSCPGNVASMSSKDGIFGPSAVSNDSLVLKGYLLFLVFSHLIWQI
jgi:hypothetical protein